MQALQAQLAAIVQGHPLLSALLHTAAGTALRRAIAAVGRAVALLPERVLLPLYAVIFGGDVLSTNRASCRHHGEAVASRWSSKPWTLHCQQQEFCIFTAVHLIVTLVQVECRIFATAFGMWVCSTAHLDERV